MPKNEDPTKVIEALVREWLDAWIIKENLCPFAAPAKKQNKIRIQVVFDDKWDDVYAKLQAECEHLLNDGTGSTTLLALYNVGKDFFEYLHLLDGAQQRIEQEGWLGTFQLASFHPDYLFEGEAPQSPTHYSNRSPLPIIHILSEDEVSKVIPNQEAADNIVLRNQAHLKKMGIDEVKRLLANWTEKLNAIRSTCTCN